MKTRIFFLLIIILSALFTEAQKVSNLNFKKDTAFSEGEKLTYQIRFGLLVAGVTRFSLTDTIYQGKRVFHALAIGQTTGLADKLFSVKDIYESWFNKKSILPYKQIRNISEGKYDLYNEVTYNRKNNTITSKLSGVHHVPAKILDLASSFYYLRRLDFSKVNEGDTISFNMYFADTIYPFQFRYLGKETVKTKFGKLNCLKICPVVEVGRMFKKQDDVMIWFTVDKNCLPVVIRMNIRNVGTVHLKLIDFKNISNQLTIL